VLVRLEHPVDDRHAVAAAADGGEDVGLVAERTLGRAIGVRKRAPDVAV